MRKTDYIPVCVVALLGGFIAFQVTRAPPRPPTIEAVAADQRLQQQRIPTSGGRVAMNGAVGRPPEDVDGTMRMSADPAPVRDVDEIRRRLRMGESGTYVSEALRQLDSSLYRWQDRLADPIRVWVAPAPGPASDDLMHIAREGFADWGSAGIPVRFTFVVNRENADAVVLWTDRFDSGNRLGHTQWVYDQHAWMSPGTEITLATHHPEGQPVSNALLRGIAAHEVGHLLGLPHSADSADVMFPRLYVYALSQADRATARLLYSVPAGSLK